MRDKACFPEVVRERERERERWKERERREKEEERPLHHDDGESFNGHPLLACMLA